MCILGQFVKHSRSRGETFMRKKGILHDKMHQHSRLLCLNIKMLDTLFSTHISDGNPKETLSVVVGLGHSLGLLKLLTCTPHLIGYLMGTINVCVGRKPSNQNLQTQFW